MYAQRLAPPTLYLKADADAYIRADLSVRENDNYGLQGYFQVGTGREPTGAADKMRSLVHFNTAILPSLALSGAALQLGLQGYDGDNPGPRDSVYMIDAHQILGAWVEGNGYEGPYSSGGAAGGGPKQSVDPDGANGVAWAGAGNNSDPAAANNTTQPAFSASVLATQTINQQTNVRGDIFNWDVTSLAQSWLNKTAANYGLMLADASTDGTFRGVRFGSRDGELYHLPNAVSGPLLALTWNVGTIPGDLTGGGCVDINDQAILLAVVRAQAIAGPGLEARLDLNNDGKVDIADARKIATLFTRPLGVSCP